MMARSTNAPFKGRIQKRKTNHLQIITFGLQRTAGPYKGARLWTSLLHWPCIARKPRPKYSLPRLDRPEARLCGMADIFISYTSSDRDWAFWVGHELQALGHTPRIHEWEIPAGGDIAAWMEARHDAADHILCIVSSAYLAKPYSAWERRAAQWAAATDRPNFAVPVFVEPCKAPTLFAHLKRCDLYDLSEGDARARLKTFLEPAAKPPRGIFPGGAKALSGMASAPPSFPGKAALSNVPIAVPLHFMGREDALAAIETALQRYEGRVAITALHGLRGVGKTTLAAAYAERHRGDYRATWWIRAQTEPTLRADLVGARRAAGLGRRGREGGAGARGGDGAAAARGRGHPADLRQRDRCQRAQALSAARRRRRKCWSPRTRTPGAAWRRRSKSRLWPKEIGADYLIARTGRRGRARGGRGFVGGARRPAARARAGGGLLRAARNVRLPNTRDASTPRRPNCSTMRATRRPSIMTA